MVVGKLGLVEMISEVTVAVVVVEPAGLVVKFFVLMLEMVLGAV